MNKQNKQKLSKLILLTLEKAIDGSVEVAEFTYHPERQLYGSSYQVKKSHLSLTLKRLREQGMIEFIDQDKLLVKLTDRGRQEAIWAAMKLDQSEWDGKWRLVSFDIPEKQRLARDTLRNNLKQWGFKQLQKSLWATKKNCASPLKEFIYQLGIEDWVIVIETQSLNF